ICKVVTLTLEHGNNDVVPGSYEALGMIANARFGHHDAAYRFGKIGCDLLERRGLNHLGGRVYYLFGVMVAPWTRPFREGIDPTRRAFQLAKEHGDPAFAAHACRGLSSLLFAMGHPLDHLELEAEHLLEFVRPFGFFLDRISPLLALVRMLRGKTRQFGFLDDDGFS